MEIIRIGDIGRWTFVSPSEKVGFASYKPRTIRVQVRASVPVFWAVDRVTEHGEALSEFLCLTPAGMSCIEVAIDSTGLQLIPQFEDGEHVAFSCPEYEPFDLEAAHPGVSFLTIAHRRERNPQVEMMEFLMNQNMNARMAQMDEEIARRLSALTPEERKDDGDGVHERPASKREKLPKDPAGAKSPPSAGSDVQRKQGGVALEPAGAEDGDEPASGEGE